MLTLIRILCLLASLGVFLTFRKRQGRWLLLGLPFLLVPLALYALIAFACYFRSDCL
jgi:hypothetical protein